MKSRLAALACAAAVFVCVAVWLVRADDGKRPAEICTEPIETLWDVEDTLQWTEERLEGALVFGEERLAYDASSRTYYCPLRLDDAQWPEIPLCVAAPGIRAAWVDEYMFDDKAEAVADGVRYSFMVWDGERYTTAGVVFTGLPVVQLYAGRELTREDTLGSVRISDSENGLYVSMRANLRTRGSSATQAEKKSYRMKLMSQGHSGRLSGEALPVLGMPAGDTWVLIAGALEGTRVRDKLALDIWNGFAREDDPYYYGTQGEFVELFLDDAYMGLYVLAQAADAEVIARAGKTRVIEQDVMYRSMYLGYTTAFERPVQVNEWNRFYGYQYRYPEKTEAQEDDWALLNEYVALSGGIEEMDAFRKAAEGRVDVRNAIDYWLFVQACALNDNVRNNLFIWWHDEPQGYVLSFFPWDLDKSFGIEADTGSEDRLTALGGIKAFPIAMRLVAADVDGARGYWRPRWQTLREGVLSEAWLEERIAWYEHVLNDSGAYRRESARWMDEEKNADLYGLVSFMSERLALLDDWILMVDDDSLFIVEEKLTQ